ARGELGFGGRRGPLTLDEVVVRRAARGRLCDLRWGGYEQHGFSFAMTSGTPTCLVIPRRRAARPPPFSAGISLPERRPELSSPSGRGRCLAFLTHSKGGYRVVVFFSTI